MMIQRLAAFLLIAASLGASEFQNGQAARAIIGQASFSARDTGIVANAIAVTRGRLYVADVSNRLLTFDTSRIPSAKDDFSDRQGLACALCGFAPLSIAHQAVISGVAATATFGKTIIVADSAKHRVLIWRGSSSRTSEQPDVVLGQTTNSNSSISANTVVEPVSVAYDGKRLFVGDAALHRVLVWNSLPFADDQAADAVLGQPDFTSANINDPPAANSLRVPAALASDGSNLFVADNVDRRILVFTPGETALAESALVNAASLSPGPVAPGTLVLVNGSGLSEVSLAPQPTDGEPVPRKLGGLEVIFNGVPLPILSVKPDQALAQMPYDFASATAGSLYVRSERSNGSIVISNAIPVKLVPAAPGIYAFGGTEPRAALMLRGYTIEAGQSGTPVTQQSAAKPGDTITIWATGLGVAGNGADSKVEAGVPYTGEPADVVIEVTAYVNGQPAQVVSATLPPGSIGIYEIRVIVPNDLPASGPAQLVLSQNGTSSNIVTFPVQSFAQ